MSNQLRSSLTGKWQDITDSIAGRTIAIDGFNYLYQSLAAYRTAEGDYFRTSEGVVTSHVIGLLYKLIPLIKAGANLIFIKDGIAPELKKDTRKRRRDCQEKYVDLVKEISSLKNYDSLYLKKLKRRIIELDPEIFKTLEELLNCLGVTSYASSGEGDAECAHLFKKGLCDYIASNDKDTLLFGGSNLLNKLSIQDGRIYAELVELKPNLEKLDLSLEQLIDAGILSGCDYFEKGVAGVGPKNAIRLVKKHNHLNQMKNQKYDFSEIEPLFEEIRELFLKPCVTDVEDPENLKKLTNFKEINFKKLEKFLLKKCHFRRKTIFQLLGTFINIEEEE